MNLSLLFAIASAQRHRRQAPIGWVQDCQPNRNGINHVPGVCNQFYLCTGGIPNDILTCGPGTAFNGVNACVFPGDAECDAPWRKPTKSATTPSTATTAMTTTTTRITGTPRTISTVFLMARALLNGSGLNGFVATDVNNYGCTGRGEFDPFSRNMGKPVDAFDKAFFNWKKCVQCATGSDKKVEVKFYDFDLDNLSCGKLKKVKQKSLNLLANSSTESRPVCECDYALISQLVDADPNSIYVGYDASNCIKNPNPSTTTTQCCNWNNYFYAHYNPDKYCCGETGIKTIGNC